MRASASPADLCCSCVLLVQVYPPGTTQKFIFEDCTKPIIDSVLNGYNGTLFCYGSGGTLSTRIGEAENKQKGKRK